MLAHFGYLSQHSDSWKQYMDDEVVENPHHYQSFLTLDIASAFKALKTGGDITNISVNGVQKSQLGAREAGACHKIPQFQAVL